MLEEGGKEDPLTEPDIIVSEAEDAERCVLLSGAGAGEPIHGPRSGAWDIQDVLCPKKLLGGGD
jgi:hypothetical protein